MVASPFPEASLPASPPVTDEVEELAAIVNAEEFPGFPELPDVSAAVADAAACASAAASVVRFRRSCSVASSRSSFASEVIFGQL